MPRKKKVPSVESKILTLREQQVILDEELAELYGVSNKTLLQAVRRNPERFPSDFVFRLENTELSGLKSQVVTTKGRGGRRSLPLAFTAEGVAMLSGLLNSDHAVRVNINVMREFVRLRSMADLRNAVRRKLDDLEHRVDVHDEDLQKAFGAIEQMMTEPVRPKPLIGFERGERKALRKRSGLSDVPSEN